MALLLYWCLASLVVASVWALWRSKRRLPWRVARVACRLVGHRVVVDERGSPVTSFELCTRCGKWWR